MYDAALRSVCRSLGTGHSDRFLFTSGGTAALSLAIAELPWVDGDEVITSAVEHHALARAVQKLERQCGVVRHVAPYAPGHPIDLDFVEGTLKRRRVKLIAITGASNVTGEVLPVAPLARLAATHGVPLLLDAAQTFGVLEQPPVQLGADIVVFAGHKAPLGPQGVGGFWADAGVQFDSPAAVCDVSSSAACSDFPGFCDVGSVNMAGAVGVAAGLEWIESEGRAYVRRSRQLAADAAARLRDDGVRVYGHCGAEQTAIVAFAPGACPLAEVERRFAELGIILRAGQHCAPEATAAIGAPAGVVRASFGVHNDERDMECFVRAALQIAV
jgi:selenocysteine lyase/cysteine desulfurase